MIRKLLVPMGILFLLSIFVIGCSSQQSSQGNLTLEQSIGEIIRSKGSGYNFLEDEAYIKHMEKLGDQLVTNKNAVPAHYAIGNLDDGNIPELVVFQERDSNNMEDQGSLEVYKFDGNKYILLDTISMNFDNTNYQMEIGRISKTQNGLLLNNQVGAHSGLTYGFIIENGKLKNILNTNKIPLLSVYTSNEIKDIDNDGILNFSIFIIDPESTDFSMVDSDKMTLWYKWDGRNSGELVLVQRKNHRKDSSNKQLFDEAKAIININLSQGITFINDNQDKLSTFDNTELLMAYIQELDEILDGKSKEVAGLFEKYQKEKNYDYIFNKYGLTMEKLNSLEYLNRNKVLKDEEELKQNIIDHINLGYKVATTEGLYYYMIDYQFLLDLFARNITNEYKDYLNIMALNTSKPFMSHGSLIIPREELVERILATESFSMVYPYSNLLDEIEEIYEHYIHIYFYGDLHNPNFHIDTLIIKDEALKAYEQTIEKYPYTNFALIVQDFIGWLEENDNMVNDKVREKLNNVFD